MNERPIMTVRFGSRVTEVTMQALAELRRVLRASDRLERIAIKLSVGLVRDGAIARRQLVRELLVAFSCECRDGRNCIHALPKRRRPPSELHSSDAPPELDLDPQIAPERIANRGE